MARIPIQLSRARLLVALVLPTLAILTLAVAPLVTGAATLTHRDVFTTHMPMTRALAAGLAEGRMPLVDPYRGAGQALAGNPNAVPLYPTRLLHGVASPLWVQNAHFWLHWLLAPLAGWWLGRAFGLGRVGAWTVGVAWATGGFFLSQLNLLNLVAGAALAPALVAAVRRWSLGAGHGVLAAVGVLWGLLLLAGDPIFALLAALAAGAAAAEGLRSGPLRRTGLLAAALGAGTLLAAPMLLELFRILPTSYRGYWQLSPRSVLAQSWDPRSALELLLPLVFGGTDLSFWGQRFHGGNPPLFHSLAPGPIVLALVVLGGLGASSRPAGRWAVWMVGGGVFLALGAFNPLMVLALRLPGSGLMRYPVKAWLLVALGLSLLAGLGMERAMRAGPRDLRRVLAGLALVYGALWWAALRFGPAIAARIAASEAGRVPAGVLEAEPARWAAIALTGLILATAASGACFLDRRPILVAALVLALQALGQLLLLGPLVEVDAVAAYRAPSPLLAAVDSSHLTVHGGLKGVFGPAAIDLSDADASGGWLRRLARLHAAQLYPFSGTAHGLRYALNPSTEGLDTFYVAALAEALPRLPDDLHRLRVLRAAGVDRLILDRPLDATADLGPPLASLPGPFGVTSVWATQAPRFPVLATTVRPAPDLGAAVRILAGSELDPAVETVLPGSGPVAARPPGTAELLGEGAELLDLEVRSPAGGVLVTRRAWLPGWRARVDGRPAATVVANGHLLAVEIPPGVHRVRLEIDRRPFRAGVVGALGGGLALLALLVTAGSRGSAERRPG